MPFAIRESPKSADGIAKIRTTVADFYNFSDWGDWYTSRAVD